MSTSVTRPDGSTTTTEYDAAGRIASIVHAKAGTELAHDAYRYDLNGNRIEQKESNGAVTGDAEQTTGYTYDAADRLTQVVTPDRTTDYTIDPVGNRTGEQIHNAANTLISHSTLGYNEREQLTSRDDAAHESARHPELRRRRQHPNRNRPRRHTHLHLRRP